MLNLYGNALRMMGPLDQALEVLQRALRLNEELHDVSAASTSRSNIANVLVAQRRIDAAIDLYWDDIRLCRESDPPHPYHEANTLSNLGAALATAERFADALSPLREAIEIRRRLGDQLGIASSAKNLGGVLLRFGRDQNDRRPLEEAIAVLEETGSIYRQRGNESGAAGVANNLGQAQCMLRRFTEGFANLETAIDYFERSRQTELAAHLRQDLQWFRHAAQNRQPAMLVVVRLPASACRENS